MIFIANGSMVRHNPQIIQHFFGNRIFSLEVGQMKRVLILTFGATFLEDICIYGIYNMFYCLCHHCNIYIGRSNCSDDCSL